MMFSSCLRSLCLGQSIDLHSLDFNHVPMWIQIWGSPLHYKTSIMGTHLREILGKIYKQPLYEFLDKAKNIHIKI